MKNNKVLWVVSFIPLVLSSIAFGFLPEEIPMHYDIEGNIDRWGSRYETFILPIIILAVSFMWQCLIGYYEKKTVKMESEKAKVESETSIKVLKITALVLAMGFGIMHIIITYSSYVETINHATKSMLDLNAVTNILWGIIIIILGNYLPKAKRNHIIGFRMKKSLSDDTVWRKSNRFAGISLVIAGAAVVMESLLIGGILSTILMILILLITTLIDMIYTVRL